MNSIKVIQIGMGPLGIKVAEFINQRTGISTVASIDKNPELIGKALSSLSDQISSDIMIENDLEKAIERTSPDVAVVTTVSDMERITPQIFEVLTHGIPIVSTCEELSFPWDTAPDLARSIDQKAREQNVAVVGLGVNPGFLMDSLPAFLTSVCQNVERVTVNRYQNAAYRRIPFQQKIGAGLTMGQFEEKKQEGSLRHVGLTESIQFIAHCLGWKLDNTEDVISPVIATQDIVNNGSMIPAGNATGVCQVGKGFINGEAKITLTFQATVGEPESYDEILIEGSPNIKSRIEGGVNGDVATCAITVNACRQILKAMPGLRTMSDLPFPTYFSN